jgi:hypothetical protein
VLDVEDMSLRDATGAQQIALLEARTQERIQLDKAPMASVRTVTPPFRRPVYGRYPLPDDAWPARNNTNCSNTSYAGKTERKYRRTHACKPIKT